MLGGCAAAVGPATPDSARFALSYAIGRDFTAAAQRKFHTVYSFVGAGDGKRPTGRLIEANGVFFGTTQPAGDRAGVVFSYTPSGGERVLHVFKRDAENPDALTYLNGELYGTTQSGGAHNAGTVFSLSLSGSKRLLYSFGGGTDGVQPTAIVAVGGKLYGTTQIGGAYDFGTVFELSTS